MIFVWGNSGPNAAAHAAATPIPVIPDLEVVEGMPTATISGHKVVPNFTVCTPSLAMLSFKLPSTLYIAQMMTLQGHCNTHLWTGILLYSSRTFENFHTDMRFWQRISQIPHTYPLPIMGC